MALDEQVISTLDSHQANPALASGADAVMPFNPRISDEVLLQFSNMTANAIKKREDDYKRWEENVVKEYNSIKPTSDIYDADREVINNERKNAFNNIAKNTIYLSPAYQIKNPQKYNEIMANSQAYLEKVQMSKDDKVFEKSVIDMMKKDSAYDNVVNQARLEKFRSTPLGERERFIPVADNSLDILRQTKNILEQTKGDLTKEVISNPEMGSVQYIYKNEIPSDKYYSVVSPININYDKAYFNDLATDEEKALGFDEWHKRKILSSKPDNVTERITEKNNFAQQLQSQEARTTETNETRKIIAQKNNETKERMKAYEQSVKDNPEFDKVNTALGQIDLLKGSVESNLNGGFVSDINARFGTNYVKAQKLDSSNIPPDLVSKIYRGGKAEYGDAYGSLFYVEDANGSGKFVAGKPEYLVENREVTKEIYKESTSKDKRVDIVPDMRAGRVYTTDELAKQIATSTEKGKAQWNRYEAGKPKVETNQSGANLTFKHKNILGYVDEFKGMGIGIGAIDTGGHNQGTLHGKTLAVDIPQSKNGGVKQLEALLPKLREKYPELDIVNEIYGPSRKGAVWGGPHIHIEMDSKKASFPSSSDKKASSSAKKVWTGKFDSKGNMIYK